MINETKAMVLLEMNINSEVSQQPITGTGTDSCAIIANPAGPASNYVGKHLLAGELLARSVKNALDKSLAYPH